MKTVLVTGHRGLLGSACVRHFSKNYEVLTIDGNLLDPEVVKAYFALLTPDYVIHCAAKVGGVNANRTKPVEFLTQNLLIQNNVISTAAQSGVEKLVFVGTSCMYPRNTDLPVSEESLLTGKLESSVEAYAIAKIAGWRLCKAYSEQYGKNFVTVNPSNIYGINDNYRLEDGHVIPALISKLHKAVQEKGTLHVWGTGRAVREFIYADDAARAIAVILKNYNSPEVINVGTGVGTSISGLVDAVCGVIGMPQDIFWDTSKPEGIPQKTFNISKLEALGWKPETTLAEGLKLTYKDYLTNPNIRKDL